MKPGNYWIVFNDGCESGYFLKLFEVVGQFALIGWTELEPWPGYWTDGNGENWQEFHDNATRHALCETAEPAWFNVNTIHHLRYAKEN